MHHHHESGWDYVYRFHHEGDYGPDHDHGDWHHHHDGDDDSVLIHHHESDLIGGDKHVHVGFLSYHGDQPAITFGPADHSH